MTLYFIKDNKIHTNPPAVNCKEKCSSETLIVNFLIPDREKCKNCFGGTT